MGHPSNKMHGTPKRNAWDTHRTEMHGTPINFREGMHGTPTNAKSLEIAVSNAIDFAPGSEAVDSMLVDAVSPISINQP